MSNDRINLDSRIRELVAEHGSLRAVGRLTGLDHSYLHRMMHGEKDNPSDETLLAFSLKRVSYYTRIKP